MQATSSVVRVSFMSAGVQVNPLCSCFRPRDLLFEIGIFLILHPRILTTACCSIAAVVRYVGIFAALSTIKCGRYNCHIWLIECQIYRFCINILDCILKNLCFCNSGL